jgi:AcrR family transcriptional regulator
MGSQPTAGKPGVDAVEDRARQRVEAMIRRSKMPQPESPRESIIRAATEVVGEVGYAKASIQKITARAGLGQGTFYSYFGSRQALFDVLLPEASEELRRLVLAKLEGQRSLAEVEVTSFLCIAEYVRANPWYARILLEAETMAPVANQVNAQHVTRQHLARLAHHWERGELPGYRREDLPALSGLLLEVRRHLVKCCSQAQPVPVPIESVISVSVQLIRGALTQPAAGNRCTVGSES